MGEMKHKSRPKSEDILKTKVWSVYYTSEEGGQY